MGGHKGLRAAVCHLKGKNHEKYKNEFWKDRVSYLRIYSFSIIDTTTHLRPIDQARLLAHRWLEDVDSGAAGHGFC